MTAKMTAKMTAAAARQREWTKLRRLMQKMTKPPIGLATQAIKETSSYLIRKRDAK